MVMMAQTRWAFATGVVGDLVVIVLADLSASTRSPHVTAAGLQASSSKPCWQSMVGDYADDPSVTDPSPDRAMERFKQEAHAELESTRGLSGSAKSRADREQAIQARIEVFRSAAVAPEKSSQSEVVFVGADEQGRVVGEAIAIRADELDGEWIVTRASWIVPSGLCSGRRPAG